MSDRQSRPSGRMVRVGSGELTYQAFVPNALPPEIVFTGKLVLALSDADRALGELAGLGRSVANPHLLIRPFVRREAVLSSRIEGTQAGVEDLYAYEAGQLGVLSTAGSLPTPDVREVANYVQALEYGLDRLASFPLSLRLIREIHERLMDGVRGQQATPGEFRRSQNWIGRPGCTLNEATYVPPPVADMHEALAALEHYLHGQDNLPPLMRVAAIHYQFETIHPFLDGNGRLGRLLVSLLLTHWNLLPMPLLYLSAYFERNREEYYDRLLAVSYQGAWHDWMVYFLTGVAEEARDAAMRAKRLQDLQADYRERLAHMRASALPMQLVDRLFGTPVISITQAQHMLDAAYNSARLAIEKLTAAGILESVDDATYGKAFVARGILDAIR